MINCGTDIVKISRLEKALETPGFYEKVFGENERAEFEKRGARLESLAAAFAAKEAFGKALAYVVAPVLREFSVLRRQPRARPCLH